MERQKLELTQKKLSPESKHNSIETFQKRLLNDVFAERLLKKLHKGGLAIDPALITNLKCSENAMGEEAEKALREKYGNEILNYLHNAGFRETHLRDGNSLKNLEIHQLGNVEKKRCTENLLKILPKYIAGARVQHFMQRKFNPRLLAMTPSEEQLLVTCLQKAVKGESTVIISNHDTFGNLPMIIIKLMIVAHTLGIKNVNQYISTIIGPLLDTHKWQKYLINMLSNIIITQPADNTPPELKEAYKVQRSLAKEAIISSLQQGTICIVAPSGTRDIVLRKKDGTVKIYLPDESHISNRTSFALVREIVRNELADVLLIGVNSTELKRGISPSNNDWNKNAEIEMHIKDISHQERDTKENLSDLTSLITSKEKVVAELLPYDLFKEIKRLQKSDQLEGFLQSDGDINREKIEKNLTHQ
jgi:hypothetical protein